MSILLASDAVAANDREDRKCRVARSVFAICLTRHDCAELLPKPLVVTCPANAFGSPFGAIDTLVSRPCSLAFAESMIETGEMSQETTPVHDVLSLFQDKIVHDVMNPDN